MPTLAAALTPNLTAELLEAVRTGDTAARDRLWQHLYGELKKLAAGHLRGERTTLEPTAVVHEIFVRLAEVQLESQQRRQFLALASTAMRRLLIDRARQRVASKRAGIHLEWDEAGELPAAEPAALWSLSELELALAELSRENPLLGRIVELRALDGATIEEMADELGLAPATIKRKWRLARAWLWQRMANHGA